MRHKTGICYTQATEIFWICLSVERLAIRDVRMMHSFNVDADIVPYFSHWGKWERLLLILWAYAFIEISAYNV